LRLQEKASLISPALAKKTEYEKNDNDFIFTSYAGRCVRLFQQRAKMHGNQLDLFVQKIK
jgi:hypothetical protein